MVNCKPSNTANMIHHSIGYVAIDGINGTPFTHPITRALNRFSHLATHSYIDIICRTMNTNSRRLMLTMPWHAVVLPPQKLRSYKLKSTNKIRKAKRRKHILTIPGKKHNLLPSPPARRIAVNAEERAHPSNHHRSYPNVLNFALPIILSIRSVNSRARSSQSSHASCASRCPGVMSCQRTQGSACCWGGGGGACCSSLAS